MNALAPIQTEMMISSRWALDGAGIRARAIVRGLEAKGHPPRPFCSMVLQDRRLFAVLSFDGTDETLSLPLDIWLGAQP